MSSLIGLGGKSISSKDRTKVIVKVVHQAAGKPLEVSVILDAEVDVSQDKVQAVLVGAMTQTIKLLKRIGAIRPTAPKIPTHIN